MFRSTLVALSLFVAPAAHAMDVTPAMSQYIYDDLMRWINHKQIVRAISLQNHRVGTLLPDEIAARDAAWRAEIGKAEAPMIAEVLNAPLSEFLREHLANSSGRITEVMVMDHNGMSIAASGVTSDCWQGDEAKFQQTYPKGSGAVFIDDVALNEHTQTYQGQVSFAVTDPATGMVIGAITVGLDASAFF